MTMKLARRAALACGLGIALMPGLASAMHAPVDRTLLTNKLQAIADSYVATRSAVEGITAFSASVSLGANAGPNLNVVSGRVSAAADAPAVTPSHLFEIGSITKSMTAVVVLQLVEEGVLSLDAPIGGWLPEYPAWREVTLRRLLEMTSGIPGYGETDAFIRSVAKWGLKRHFSKEQLISFVDPELSGAPPPTTGYDYSNTNYILAETIIERATGVPLAEHIARRILSGHGLTSTYYSDSLHPDSVLDRLVSGALVNVDGPDHPLQVFAGKDIREQNLSWGRGAGGAISTPEDVTRWVRLVFQSPILSDAARRELTRVVSMQSGLPIAAISADDPRGFGLGVAMALLDDRASWSYEGATMGYRAIYGYFPKDNLVIAIALNSFSGPEDNISKALVAFREVVIGEILHR